MNLSDLIAGLQKFTPILGEAEVILHEVDSGVQSVVHDLGIRYDPSTGNAGSSLTLNHGAAPPVPTPEPAPLATEISDSSTQPS